MARFFPPIVRRLLTTTFFVLCVSNVNATAQEEQPLEEVASLNAETDALPYVAADTSSPRATLRSFINACNELYEIIESERFIDRVGGRQTPVAYRILDCIDVSELPAFAREERASEIAVCLKEIIDREEIPAWEEIPDSEDLQTADGSERLAKWRIPGTRITIARIEDGPQKHEYLFSAGTVERAPSYFRGVQALPYRTTGPETSPGLYKWYMSAPGHPMVAKLVNRLPDSMRFGRTLGLANWKWPGLILVVIAGIALMAFLYRLSHKFGLRVEGRRIVGTCMVLILPFAALLVPFCVQAFAKHVLSIRGDPLYVIGFTAIGVSIFAGMFFLFSGAVAIGEAIISSPQINPKGLNAQLIRIACRLIGLALACTLFLVGGQYAGIPVATLLASAGIGGIALALGAQDTLKTLFGTVMLMADRPFGVGDRIVFKGYDGIVEDIGMRSTRIRLLTSHQVSVPNDELARSDIENVGRRKCIRRSADIHLPLDTSFKKTQAAVQIIRDELQDHEGMDPDYPPRVFFLDFGDNAFTIRVIYWYHPPNYWDYLAFSEKFNFAIFSAFEKEGIEFSLAHRLTSASSPTGSTAEPFAPESQE